MVYVAPDAVVAMEVPPVGSEYHLIVFPVEAAEILTVPVPHL